MARHGTITAAVIASLLTLTGCASPLPDHELAVYTVDGWAQQEPTEWIAGDTADTGDAVWVQPRPDSLSPLVRGSVMLDVILERHHDADTVETTFADTVTGYQDGTFPYEQTYSSVDTLTDSANAFTVTWFGPEGDYPIHKFLHVAKVGARCIAYIELQTFEEAHTREQAVTELERFSSAVDTRSCT
jgi:hypothetical protein